MTEDEAEAALLALGGPQLEWAHFSNFYGEPSLHEFAEVATGLYSVNIPKGVNTDLAMNQYISRWQAREDAEIETETCVFESLSAAKAACERHFATGKWTE